MIFNLTKNMFESLVVLIWFVVFVQAHNENVPECENDEMFVETIRSVASFINVNECLDEDTANVSQGSVTKGKGNVKNEKFWDDITETSVSISIAILMVK